MSTYKYKSDAVSREFVLRSAGVALVSGLLVNLPVAASLIGTSMVAGCYERSDYIQALVTLPVVHLLVSGLVFILMCSMYVLVVERTNGDHPKE